MQNKKVLTIQDISCYGQCSITVALPILSAWGMETAILPSAILSTHTAGFKNFTVHDLSNEIPSIIKHWKDEGLKFDCLYSGYLGETNHIDLVIQIKNSLLKENAPFILDPVMGDNGKIYPAFNDGYVKAMKRLIKEADVIIPNLTEACLLTGLEYKTNYDKEYIDKVIDGLKSIGAKTIILTGISYEKDTTGIIYYDSDGYHYYQHRLVNASYHGTGDIYASTLVGAYLNDIDLFTSSKIAAHFVIKSIENTLNDDTHKYGVKFEPLLVDYINEVINK